MTNNTPDYGPARISFDGPVGHTVSANRAATFLDKQDLMDLPAARRFVAKAFKNGSATARTLNGDKITASVAW